MPSVQEVQRAKSVSNTDIDARWLSLEAMSPAAWGAVKQRVSVCLDCLGPALLTDTELAQDIAAPRCKRCGERVAA